MLHLRTSKGRYASLDAALAEIEKHTESKDWEGKPDKLQFFSPNPGGGD
jgi:hypothetical protein